MKSPSEQVHLLLRELRDIGVDSKLLGMVTTHLPANYKNPEHWAELASVLRRSRNYGAAELIYKTALQLFARSSRLWNNYGILLREWGKLGQALNAFDQAIGLDGSYAKAITNKGNVLELLHKFAEARACYQAALDIDPSDAVATHNMGVCLLGEGEASKAEAWFEKTLQLDPDWSDALFNLALLRLDRGDFESAGHLVQRLSRLLPNDPDVQTLQARLRDRDSERMKIELPHARKLESDLNPPLRKLCEELAGDPRSLFISYAWPDSSTKQFATRLSQDLKGHSFRVVLDQKLGLDVWEVLCLLPHCQNVVVLNDAHYAESCLLGKVPITKTTSIYPSFAFPIVNAQSEEYLGMVFKISAVAWEVARQMKEKGIKEISNLAFQVALPEAFSNVPGLRLFIEGWRVDEIQMVFANVKNFRSISIAYLGGTHCLAGYPLFDFSKEEYYAASFAALLKVLELGRRSTVDDAPIEFNNPDWSRYCWKDSSIVSAKLWKISNEDVAVWRPSITPSGGTAAVINIFKEWNPI
ncbi:MAG: tetratricopeptide repeat protein [Planctomycetes bacterium]|nr:tetratricopeptide repeat protein [Planctomycetota bacterium]